ncbi:MAG: hypothetical protein AB1499_09405 [Nitrospirota bacterium]
MNKKTSFNRSFTDKTTFRKLISLKQKINILQLLFNRISIEFKDDWIKFTAKRSGLPRMINKLEGDKQYKESDFLTSMMDRIKLKTKVAQDNFEFLNAAVNELLQAENVDSNFKVQKRMLWLTIVMAFLTVITALPEGSRIIIFRLVSDRFRETINLIVNYWQ